MALLRTVDPASEPLTTAEAKAHLRVTHTDDDTYIDVLIKAVRQAAENILGRSLITQTWEKTLDEFPDAIELAYPPVIAVSSIVYLEAAAGVSTALSAASYVVDTKAGPGWVVPAYGYTWPDTYETINAVTVTYTAGYGAASDVPEAIKQWLLIRIGSLYEYREDVALVTRGKIDPLPFIDSLLDPFRVLSF